MASPITLRFDADKPYEVALAEHDYARDAENYYRAVGDKYMSVLADLAVSIFADGAELSKIEQYANSPLISGFTTNPTLIRKSGITDYREFAGQVLRLLPPDKPISFEVIADDHLEAYAQAREIHSWGEQVYVKVPVVNAEGVFNGFLLERLAQEGVKVNVTAIFTEHQLDCAVSSLKATRVPCVLSVFAGRVADTGVDPVPLMKRAKARVREVLPDTGKLLWASTRQVYDVVNAHYSGCDIITLTPDLISKLALFGKSLNRYSVETVQMFRDDALAAGLKI